MSKIKLVYEKNNNGDKYDECSVTGIHLPNWFSCLLSTEKMPDYIYCDIMDEFWNEFYSQISTKVSDDIRDNPSTVIYMYNLLTKGYDVIYKHN